MARSVKLDVDSTKVVTSYCISADQRDYQMRLNIPRVKERLYPVESVSDEEIAVVCFGPSLKKTWSELKNFKTIITCSGAHKFLLERGITPTYHVDLDPRPHKVEMLGTPHKDTTYLIASCCNPNMLDKLEGFKVKLWHIYANETNQNLPLVYPRGEWILTGGCNVGLRCLVIARVLGFRRVHVFGMDCSFPKDSGHHADTHTNASKKSFETPYGGKMYYCEPVMLDYARTFFHEVEQLPDMTFKLHGEGLLQHMVANEFKPVKTKPHAVIAFSTPPTISDKALQEAKRLHLSPVYGIDGKKHKDVILKLSESLKTKSIMDYGCGKGTLGASLPFPIWEYDPAVPGKDGVPRPADICVCINVLEFVEEEMIENVLGDICRCTNRVSFLIISGKKDFWEPKLSEFFKIGAIFEQNTDLHCVLEPKKHKPLI